MNTKTLTLEIAVVAACYLILTLPVSSATTVNVKFNGQVMDTVEYDPSNIVNQQIRYVRDASDITWSNVRVAITLNSASLSHTVTKVYLYKCGALSPVSCMQKTPEVFDSFVDTEIAWQDIGQSSGSSIYPQQGNILFLVKLEDPDGLSSWVGLWNTIRRTSHKEFLFYRHELSDVDVHAASSSMVGPIATYIQNFNTIPFKWLSKVSFGDALSITAIGGDDNELDSSPPVLQSVQPSSTDITVINKQNYFVFPETSSGTAFPITLEENPDFDCGDGKCEENLGETTDTCCYDCLCGEGQYCDAPQGAPEDGDCKPSDLVSLDIVGTPSADVDVCSGTFEVGITARISNVPASMSDEVRGVVKVANTPYAVQCAKASPGLYDCSFIMRPTIQCGSGTRTAGPNELKLTVSYMDGTSRINADFTRPFPSINLNYDCGCGDGYYCDSGTEKCETEEAIRLGITEITSYLNAYTPGDTIKLKVKIFEPPTGTVLTSASVGLNLTHGNVVEGTPVCTGPSEDFEYSCTIPFSITGYTRSNDYKFYPNFLTFEINYNDGPDIRTKSLTKEFGPISIPNQECGNGVPDPQETSESCCQDVGCEAAGDYCDVARGCTSLDAVSLSVTPIPREFEDCKAPHDVTLRTAIANAPYGAKLDSYSLDVNGQPVAWSLECPRDSIGVDFDCFLSVPPQSVCELPFKTVGPNKLSMSISFPNGNEMTEILTKDISADFADIYITPIPHIDGTCEPELGENGSTACLDCPCAEDPAFGDGYYCDTGNNRKGTCLSRSDISLEIDSPDPSSTVSFVSCENTNKFSVLMHVKNQPSTMEAESIFATVNNEAAGYVSCRESTGTYMDSNITFNCTIRIPPVPDCRSGQVYTYGNNSISLVISYENGESRPILQTLSHPIASARITQSYRSLNEVTNEAVAEMTGVLNRIMDITESSMDRLQDCIEMQIAMFILSMLGTIAMGYVFGSTGGTTTTSTTTTTPTTTTTTTNTNTGFNWNRFGEGVQTAGTLSTQFSTMIGKICDALQKISQIEVEYQKMQIEKIKMNTCLGVAQHALDSGRCLNQEESCFSSIVGCLSGLNEMTDIMEKIGGLSNGITSDFVAANGAIAKAGEALADADWTGSSASRDQRFKIGLPKYLDNGKKICGLDGVKTSITSPTVVSECNNIKKDDASLQVNVPKEMCSKKYLYLVLNGQSIKFWESSNSGFIANSNSDKINDFIDTLNIGENKFELYCSDESWYEHGSTKFKPVGSPLTIIRGKECNYGDISERCQKAQCGCTNPDNDKDIFFGTTGTYSTGNDYTKKINEDKCSGCYYEPGKTYKFKDASSDMKLYQTFKTSSTSRDCITTDTKIGAHRPSNDQDNVKYNEGFDWWYVQLDASTRKSGCTSTVGWIKAGTCGTGCYLEEYSETPTCVEDWECSGWSATCTSGKQTQTCTDKNSCGTIVNRPPLSRDCTDQPVDKPTYSLGCSSLVLEAGKTYRHRTTAGLGIRSPNYDSGSVCATANSAFEEYTLLEAKYYPHSGQSRDYLHMKLNSASGSCSTPGQEGYVSAGTNTACNFELKS